MAGVVEAFLTGTQFVSPATKAFPVCSTLTNCVCIACWKCWVAHQMQRV